MQRKARRRRARLAVASAVVVALAALVSAYSASAATRVNGSVGPGFTISLKSKGKKVKRLKAGKSYTFRVSDKSNIHNFHLKGPGVNKVITTVGFKGTKSFTVKLKKGTYTYVCDPHASSMKGTFKAS